MPFAVIFDLDGVLIDSVPNFVQAYNELLGEYGATITPQEVAKYNGMHIDVIMKRLKEKFNLNFDTDEFIVAAMHRELELLKSIDATNPELERVLKELQQHHVPLGVATSSTAERAKEVFFHSGFSKYFTVFVTADDIRNAKPDPEIFLTAAENLKAKPESCIVIEDSPNGITAAKAAGMKSIGLLTQYYTYADLKEADLIIKDFSELSYERLEGLLK